MERGVAAARALGCWECHRGAGDAAGVPSLFGGSRDPATMLRTIREAPPHQAIPVTEGEARDLAAWIAVVQLEGERAGDPRAAGTPVGAAERLARRNCFGCHGDLGQGGARNPGSLKGYVPGFFGRDYDALTKDGDPEVVREWIRDGTPGFFHQGVSPLRLGAWFAARQQVQMPPYERTLRWEEIDMLVTYLGLLRSLGPLDAAGVARYRALQSLTESGRGR